jgi:hypothetical protein
MTVESTEEKEQAQEGRGRCELWLTLNFSSLSASCCLLMLPLTKLSGPPCVCVGSSDSPWRQQQHQQQQQTARQCNRKCSAGFESVTLDVHSQLHVLLLEG